VSSPCLWACFDPPHPLFQRYLQSKEIILNSAFNAQGSRLEKERRSEKKKRQDETHFTTKIGGNASFCRRTYFALKKFHSQLRV
jgi:hypothetical protein